MAGRGVVKRGETLVLKQGHWQDLREKGLISQQGEVVGVNRDHDAFGNAQSPVIGLSGMLPGGQIAYILQSWLMRPRPKRETTGG